MPGIVVFVVHWVGSSSRKIVAPAGTEVTRIDPTSSSG
ncbi:MAG: hypothetical protein BWX50_00711 [Euryarchaeota archaeon ADurb.Bin009]|nr:MAG: hypothetical protein BWX50_00711 [Euryarchaeota archaeon ADurb.Bin009]